MTVINSNISAIAAQNSLRTSGLNQTTAMERLSSGVRINSAKDDAAGLAISTRMTANIRGLAAAIRNANDGISLTQTAEGSLSSIGDNLQRIRELAVQSANSTNNATDRAALHAEASQLVSEIDRIAANATFNGIKLLDGSYQDQNLQVGSGNEANDRISISIASAKSSALGVGGGSSYSTVVNSTTAGVGSTALLSGALSVNGFIVGGASTDGVSSTGSDSSGIAVAAAINAVSGQSGVTASVNKTEKAGIAVGTVGGAGATGFSSVLASGAVSINGVSLGTIEAAASNIARGAQMTAAINAKSSQTGVIATFSTESGSVSLSAADGRNIEIKIASAAGTAITSAMTGIAHTDGSTTSGANITTVYRSSIKLSSSNASGITIGGITAAGLTASGLTATSSTLAYTAATATAGAGVSTVDLTTATGSQTALSTLDKAINTITDARAAMGAYQNRLTASIANLETSSMNLQASRSRILDTDYAKETTNLAKSQIIQQAATAMLAQANQSAQSVLSLLK